MTAAVSHDIYSKFADVIGKSEGDTRALVAHLDGTQQIRNMAANLRFFTDAVLSLPSFHVTGTSVRISGRSRNEIEAHAIGKGSYGTVYKSARDNIIYKEIEFSAADEADEDKAAFIESKIRETYLETFIQCVLASDPEIGNYICNPLKLYRSATTVRRGRSAAAALGATPIKLVIVMEIVKYKFTGGGTHENNYLMHLQHINGGRLLEIMDVAPLWRELSMVLKIAGNKYGYRHSDLHTGNIMVSESGHLKLIDFGMSCMSYDGKNYQALKYYDTDIAPCNSHDLLLFLTALYSFDKPYFSIAAQRTIKSWFNYRTAAGVTQNFYNDIVAKADRETHIRGGHQYVHWMVYSWELNPIERAIIAVLPMMSPTGLYDYLTELLAPPTGGPAPAALPAAAPTGGPTLRLRTITTGGPITAAPRRPITAAPPNNNNNTSDPSCFNRVCNVLGRCFCRRPRGTRRLRRAKGGRRRRQTQKRRRN